MIYNAVEDNYGFIGRTNNVSASSFAKVSVTLRVVDDAVAYVYLVNVAEQQKSVLTFEDFTEYEYDLQIDGAPKKFELNVTSDMMINGWLTVNFYIATGASSKDFRVEVWNGDRFGTDKSTGFVFVKEITVNSSASAFSEPNSINDAFTTSGNPLYGLNENTLIKYTHKRAWTELEKEFNEKHPDEALEDMKGNYAPKYVWVTENNDKNTFIYAVFNSIDPVLVDPDGHTHDDEKVSNGCTAETDPSTFWLSFSSIILAVVLLAAIIALFVKNFIRRQKANKSDAKSHYTITSRVKAKKKAEKKTAKKDIDDNDDKDNNEVEEVVEEDTVEEVIQNEEKDDNLDNYVYGDVEVFGNDEEKKDE